MDLSIIALVVHFLITVCNAFETSLNQHKKTMIIPKNQKNMGFHNF